MNKSRNIPPTYKNAPKRTITNFVRKVVKLEIEKKSPIFESQIKKENSWLKKPNDSWDY